MSVLIHSLDELDVWTQSFLATIHPQKDRATLITLEGDLGVGKTALVKRCASVLGVNQEVTSPTFVIQKAYKINHQSFDCLVHIDAYRLKGSEELHQLRWSETISNPKNLIFVEWPSIVGGLKEYEPIQISMTMSKGEIRSITQTQS